MTEVEPCGREAPEVSVIIAAYNASAYISRAISSAITQTRTTLEVIVVDDGSTDDTVDVVEAFEATVPVRCLKTKHNGGPGEARNVGLRSARGAWIAILDADDAFEPGRLRTLIDLARSWSAEMVSDNLIVRDATASSPDTEMFSPKWLQYPGYLEPIAFVQGNIGSRDRTRRAWGFMKPILSRDLIERACLRYRTSRFAEDYLFGLDALCAGARWVVTPQALYVYTLRPGSLSVALSDADLRALLAGEAELLTNEWVRQDTALRGAIADHQRSVERALGWNQFVRAVKLRRFGDATVRLLSQDGGHIAGELAAHLGRRLSRKVG